MLSFGFLLVRFIPILVQSKFEPHYLHILESPDRELGKVFGATPCGGSGEFIDSRIEGCDDTINSNCKIKADGSLHRFELDFRTSKFIEKLRLRDVSVNEDGEEAFVYMDIVMPNNNMEAGSLQRFEVSGDIPNEWAGITLRGRRIIYNVSGNVTEMCVQATLEFI